MQLNLGCGERHLPDHVNIDLRPGPAVDLVADGLRLPFADNSAEAVRAFDFLEHVRNDQRVGIIEEIWRVLKDGGVFEHLTPSTDGRGAFQDPTHLSFWCINSWFYYCPHMIGGKRHYGIRARFQAHQLRDIETDRQDRVIHTYGLMTAVKGEGAMLQ
jgi:ubiquinone/menaquinone biosynthesis C-methylase UbiE